MTTKTAKSILDDFIRERKCLHLSYDNEKNVHVIETISCKITDNRIFIIMDYNYKTFYEDIENISPLTAFFHEKDKEISNLSSEGKRASFSVKAKRLTKENAVLYIDDEGLLKIISTGFMVYELKVISGEMFYNDSENFLIGENLTVTEIGNNSSENNKKENKKHVILQYGTRTAVMNVFMDGNDYYTLTKSNAKKLEYFKEGKETTVFDSGVTFKTIVKIMDEKDTENIFSLLESVNNNYFKSPENLVALKFTKE